MPCCWSWKTCIHVVRHGYDRMDQLPNTQLPDRFPALPALPHVHEDKQEVQFASAQAKQSSDLNSQSFYDYIDVYKADILTRICRLSAPLICTTFTLPNLVFDAD